MDGNTLHYRHILLYHYNKGKRAAETHKIICRVYGDNAITERTCQNWFAKFRAGNYDIHDARRSGRPQKIDTNEIKAVVEQNPTRSVREIAQVLDVSHTSVENHLRKLGYGSRLAFAPHFLSDNSSVTNIKICNSPSVKQEKDAPEKTGDSG